jgi:hypothetical protein
MLQPIAEGVWGQETELRMPGGLRLPSRATIVRLASGELLVHSPLAVDDETARAIDALGEVRWVIAPSCFHWMFVRPLVERYPRARVLGAGGLERKLTGKHGVAFEALPSSGEIERLEGELRVERIGGAPSMDEHAFLHLPSRTLIVTDLLFNVHACSSFLMRLVLRLGSAWEKPAQSKAWRFFVKDRAAAAESATTVLGWDFERIVVAHGRVIEEDPREQARRALAWMTAGAPRVLGTGSVAA